MGKACHMAFSFGLETDPVRPPFFLEKLTRSSPDDYILTKQKIELKTVTDAVVGMPKL